MTHPERPQGLPSGDPIAMGKDTRGAGNSARSTLSVRSLRKAAQNKASVNRTPGYKAILISNEQFERFQAFQKKLPRARQLSVAVIAEAALKLAADSYSDEEILRQAGELFAKSLFLSTT